MGYITVPAGNSLPTADNPDRVGYAIAVVSSIFSALAITIGKWNLQAISSLVLNCLIFSVATVLFAVGWLPFVLKRGTFKVTRKGAFWILMFGITSWAALWAFWAGVKRMDPSLASFLNRAEIPVAILLGIVFLRERFTKWEGVGALVSIAGIVIMKMALRFEYTTGFWYVLLGSLFFGITEFVSKVGVRYVAPSILMFLRNMFMAVMFWVVFFAGGYNFDGLEKVWPGVLLLGLVGPILARIFYLLALKRMALSKAAVISQSQPVWVVLIALLFLGTLPTFREVIGGLFIVGGCLIMIVGHPSGSQEKGDVAAPLVTEQDSETD